MVNRRLYQLSRCTYICEYHVVWTPKYRGKVLADKYIKDELKRIFKQICRWKGLVVRAWHVGDEHICIYLSILPKYSVSYAVAILKGKSSAWIKKKTKKFLQGTLWKRGYFVSTAGLNEHAVKRYVENQTHHQINLEQPKIPFWRR